VIELVVDLIPAFEVSQHVYLGLPLDRLEAQFDDVMAGAYSVSLFTDWRTDIVNQVWLKRHSGEPQPPSEYFEALPAGRKLHPIADLSPDACTEQLGVSGPWHERLPHFRIDATPSAGNELQTEYFVPRRQAVAGLHAVAALRDSIAPHLLISEIRTIAADQFWMSPFYHQDSVGIHFTWKPDWPNVRSVLPQIEAALGPFGAKPHWGKLFTMSSQQLQPLYPLLPNFRDLLDKYDPHGKFRNAFLQAYLYGGPSD
jgi:alditol oxidase